MNKKIVLYVFGIATLLGLFAGGNIASADNAVPTCNSATLYGTVTPNGASTQAWFEWGPTTAMQWSTSIQTFNNTSSFSQVLSPLNSNTTYYWRAMASNSNGTATGSMMSFATSSCNTQPTVTPPTVTIYADQTNVAYASATTLHWTSANSPQTCSGSGGNGVNGWTGIQNVSGSFNTGILTTTSTFNISCTNSAGTGSNSVTIYVAGQPTQNCLDTTATNYGRALPCTYPTPVQTCQDTNANNYGRALPCTYPTQTCQNVPATNYGQPLPCQFPAAPTVTITADQTSVAYNGGTTVRWSSTSTISCNASSGSNGWSGIRNTSGTFYTGQLTSNTGFNISCSNSTGSTVSSSVFVNVAGQIAQTCQDTTATNYGGALPCIYPQAQTCQNPSATNYGGALPCHFPTNQYCQDTTATNYGGALPCNYQSAVQPTVTITADNNNVAYNSGTTVRWFSSNATSCNATSGTNGWSGVKNTSGTFYTGALTYNMSFGITCNNSVGSNSNSVLINVNNNNNNIQPTVSIYADQTSLSYNGSTIIRWTSYNADYCNATGGTNGWAGSRGASGSFNTGIITYTTTYSINCTNSQSGGTANGSVTIYDDNNNNYNNNYNIPNVTISADQTSVAFNGSTIIRWYPTNATYCTGSGGSNGWATTQSAYYGGTFNTGALTGTTTYYINCTNGSGSNSAQVTVYVSNNYNNYATTYTAAAPTAITTAATQLTNYSAQLNSLILTTGSPTNAWFEWGTTSSLGNSTNQNPVGTVASVNHSDTITGLTVGTTYYYRAAAENASLRSYGNTMSFVMENLGGTVAGTSTIRQTTIINRGGAQNLVMLTIDGGTENIVPGENRNYHVVWKNISSQTLNKVVLRVILPKQMTFQNASRGSFSNDDNNTLTLNLGTLSPGDNGDLFLLAQAGNTITQGQLLVTVANMVYTDPSNAQGNAIAYTTQYGDLSGSNLGANAFGAGFLPSTFLGWLLLLILVLIIILLSRYLYNQSKGPQAPVAPQH